MPSGVYSRTEKHREIMRRTMIKLWRNSEYREKQIRAQKGHKVSEKARERMRIAQKKRRKKITDKWYQKILIFIIRLWRKIYGICASSHT